MTDGDLEKEMSKFYENIFKNKNFPISLIAKVETPPPNLTLRYSEQIIPSKQIYCSNYLLPHYHRNYTIDGIIDNIEIDVSQYDFNNTTSSESVGDHPAHPIPKLSGSGTYKGSGIYQSHKDIWFEDTLIAGNEVLVEIVNNSYVVVAQIVRMPSEAKEGA